MFSDLPVEIFAWVFASTSGLTRIAIGRERAAGGGDGRERLEFRLQLDVEAEDFLVEPEVHLGLRLADAGKDDPFARYARGPRPPKLPLADHVHAGPEPGECHQNRLVGIGLHRVADQRVLSGEGSAEHLEVPLDGGARIAIERRADLASDRGQSHVLGAQHAVAISEVMHRKRLFQQRIENEWLIGSRDRRDLGFHLWADCLYASLCRGCDWPCGRAGVGGRLKWSNSAATGNYDRDDRHQRDAAAERKRQASREHERLRMSAALYRNRRRRRGRSYSHSYSHSRSGRRNVGSLRREGPSTPFGVYSTSRTRRSVTTDPGHASFGARYGSKPPFFSKATVQYFEGSKP